MGMPLIRPVIKVEQILRAEQKSFHATRSASLTCSETFYRSSDATSPAFYLFGTGGKQLETDETVRNGACSTLNLLIQFNSDAHFTWIFSLSQCPCS